MTDLGTSKAITTTEPTRCYANDEIADLIIATYAGLTPEDRSPPYSRWDHLYTGRRYARGIAGSIDKHRPDVGICAAEHRAARKDALSNASSEASTVGDMAAVALRFGVSLGVVRGLRGLAGNGPGKGWRKA